ncbi:anti-sigma factor [Saccharibacillus alkalitolerans]|uniref:Regulator of SigK n=1 Tax=Saccharibacillus alkalitolerans TaxID=2705290 RepID=A0ABX0F4I5_9BACL|nr:anti-sigma factor [Saccharibacillus alkalitolerans]NGZ74839.1 anti-sigma factor [Saccharibacillus alkalitolerans]
MNEPNKSMAGWAEAYVLGGLEEAEKAEYEAYLWESADERQLVAELQDTAGMLALAVGPAAPPAGMKKRILANVLADASVSPRQKDAADTADARTEQSLQNPEELLEQARQTIEAEEARRIAEERGGIGRIGTPEEPAASVTHGGSEDKSAESIGAAAAAAESHTAERDRIPASGESALPKSGTAPIGRPSAAQAETTRRAARARGTRGLWAGTAAVMAAAAIMLGIYSGQLRGELNDMRSDMTAMQQRTSDMERQLAAAAQPAVGAQVARTVPLVGSEDDPNASGMAAMVKDDTGMHLVVQANDLPDLSGSEAYQVWLIKDDRPINAGTFQSGNGIGALSYTMQPDDYDMVAITLEPDAEGEQPRGRMVLMGALNG